MSHVVLGAHESARSQRASRSERSPCRGQGRLARRRHAQWLLPLAWALTASGCTLTSEAFEPNAVERIETEADGVGPEVSPDDASSAGPGSVTSETTAQTTQTNTETPLEPTRLEPAEASAAPDVDADPGDDEPEPAAGGAPGIDPSEFAGSAEVDAATPLPVPVRPCAWPSESSCYEAFEEQVPWGVAEQRCVAWGGHLATVESAEEDAFLDAWPSELGIAAADGSGAWLGGTDAALDGDFRWTDGSAVSVDAWATNQPDNGIGLDCIEKRNDGTGEWFDLRCTDSNRYICERPL